MSGRRWWNRYESLYLPETIDFEGWDKRYYTDEWQHEALEPRAGDIRLGHNYNGIWGKTFELDPGANITAVSTQGFPINVAMAWQIRFADNANGPFTATVPVGFNGVIVELVKSIDLKAGVARETIEIDTGFSQSGCTIICRQLSIIVTAQENSNPIFCQVAACIVETIDCNDLAPNPPSPVPTVIAGYQSDFFMGRFAAADNIYPGLNDIADPDPLRRQFRIQNYSNTDVAIGYGDMTTPFPINWTPGDEQMSMILPGGISAIYESDLGCFQGFINISFKPGGPTPTGFLIGSFGR